MLNGDSVESIVITEQLLLDCFKYMKRGGRENMGVKSPVYAKYIIPEYPDKNKKDTSSSVDIQIYEDILIEFWQNLETIEKRYLIIRLGKGMILSFRLCGKEMGTNYESFRQQYQRVIKKIQKAIDKKHKIVV